jgi:hypothetical protein
MKRFKILKNYTLYTLLYLFFLTSCDEKNNEPEFYTWYTNIEVKYSDNTKDTILNKARLYKTTKPRFHIRTESKGFIDNTKLVPCVVMQSKYDRVNLACDVRSYRILTQTKQP